MIAPKPPALPFFMASSTYTTDRKQVGELLGLVSRQRLVIPEFQRGYEWGDRQVTAFWKDIQEFDDERIKPGGPRAYFFGPIVIRSETDEIELLDGQQRFATVTILLSVLRDAAAEIGSNDAVDFAKETQKQFIRKGDGYALQLGDTDKDFFREFIQVEVMNPRPNPKHRTNRNIKDARELLLKLVKGVMGESSPDHTKLKILQTIRQTIQSDLVVAAISVESETDAFRIFETLNDRGLSLSAPDLLLNFLMRRAAKEERPIIRQLWTDMVGAVEEKELSKFIRALWVSKQGDVKGNIFTAISDWVRLERMSSVDFARLCSQECEAWVAIVNADPEALGGASEQVKNLVRTLGIPSTVPILLSAFTRLDGDRFQKLCQWLLVFYVRYSVMGNQDRGGLENLLFEMATHVRTKLSISNPVPVALQEECMTEIRNKLEGSSPSNDLIEKRVDKINLKESANTWY